MRRSLDVVDAPGVIPRREFDRRDACVEDGDPVVVFLRVGELLGHAEDVSIEAQRAVEVVGLDDQAQLAGCVTVRHATHSADADADGKGGLWGRDDSAGQDHSQPMPWLSRSGCDAESLRQSRGGLSQR
ncbi:hypothetical protein GCM10009803_24860 [Microbacterium ginsengiterrae]